MIVDRYVDVTVLDAEYCGYLPMNGLRAWTVPNGLDLKLVAAPELAPISCWDMVKASDGRILFRTRPGYAVWMNASPISSDTNGKNEQVKVVGSLGGSVRPLLVDPAEKTMTPVVGFVNVSWSPPGAGQRGVLRTPVLKVPAADGQGRYTFPAWSPGGLGKLGGLDITSVQLVMRKGQVPYNKLTLATPKPMGGETPVAFESQYPETIPEAVAVNAAAARAAGGSLPSDVDFRLDVSGASLGLISVEQGWLEHRISDGTWRASLVVDVSGLGRLDAPYLADPGGTQSAECSTPVGPSGLELGGDGSFHFGGAALTANPGITLGPLFLTCIAVNAQADPFVVRGAAAGSVANLPLTFNACLAFAVLGNGQHAGQCEGDYTSQEDGLFWSRIQGSVTLINLLTLKGSVETRWGDKLKGIIVKGTTQWAYRSDPIDVIVDYGVEGAVDFESKQFALYGTVHGVVNPWGIPEIKGSFEGGITSRGVGVCAGSVGAVYRTVGGFDWFLISCNLKKLIGIAGLNRSISGRAVGTTLELPEAKPTVTFVARTTASRAAPVTPDVTLVGPGGRTIHAEDVATGRKTDGWTVVRNPQRGETYIKVMKAAAGKWRITPVAGSPKLEGVDLYVPTPDPVITGRVKGTGTSRTVSFADKNLLPADKVYFYEKGPQGYRALGVRDRDDSTVPLPAAGRASRRVVFAVVERRGIPITKMTLDDYVSSPVPDLPTPTGVTATMSGQDLVGTWNSVRGAKKYRAVLVLADGRRLSTFTTGRTVTFPQVTRFTGGRLVVTALSGPGLDSTPRADALSPIRSLALRL